MVRNSPNLIPARFRLSPGRGRIAQILNAAGDQLISESGDARVNNSGDEIEDDGLGNACCCFVPCAWPVGKTHLRLTISGVTPCACLTKFGKSYRFTAVGVNGVWDVPKTTGVLNTSVPVTGWEYGDTACTTIINTYHTAALDIGTVTSPTVAGFNITARAGLFGEEPYGLLPLMCQFRIVCTASVVTPGPNLTSCALPCTISIPGFAPFSDDCAASGGSVTAEYV